MTTGAHDLEVQVMAAAEGDSEEEGAMATAGFHARDPAHRSEGSIDLLRQHPWGEEGEA